MALESTRRDPDEHVPSCTLELHTSRALPYEGELGIAVTELSAKCFRDADLRDPAMAQPAATAPFELLKMILKRTTK